MFIDTKSARDDGIPHIKLLRDENVSQLVLIYDVQVPLIVMRLLIFPCQSDS